MSQSVGKVSQIMGPVVDVTFDTSSIVVFESKNFWIESVKTNDFPIAGDILISGSETSSKE